MAGDTREAAEGVLAQFRQQLALQGAAPERASVEKTLSEYGEHLDLNRRPGTARRYRRVLKTFAMFLESFYPAVHRLRDIKPHHLENYKRRRLAGEITEPDSEDDKLREAQLRAELKQTPRSGSPQANAKYGWLGRKRLHRKVTEKTINYALQSLHTFFGGAIKRNYLFTNPASVVERFRVPKKGLPKFLTSDDLRKFFRACDEKEQRVFSTMLLTGMRRGEVAYLTRDDINFELGVILVQTKPDEDWQPKSDERIIPISPTLHQILFEQLANRTSDKWVFPNRDGNRDTHLLDKLKKVCRRAGIRQTTLHALRHSFGAHLRMAGVNLADIADLMGHKDLATTQIYARVQQEHLRSAIGKLTLLVPAENDVSRKRVTPIPSKDVAGQKSLKART